MNNVVSLPTAADMDRNSGPPPVFIRPQSINDMSDEQMDAMLSVIRTKRLQAHNVFNLYQDSSGDIWVCTWEDGLYHISDNGTVHYTDGGADRTHCISSNSVRDCCEDNQGNLWIATFNGLDKFDKQVEKLEKAVNEVRILRLQLGQDPL